MIQLMFLKVFMLIRQLNLDNVLFANVGIFKRKGLNLKHLSGMIAMMYY